MMKSIVRGGQKRWKRGAHVELRLVRKGRGRRHGVRRRHSYVGMRQVRLQVMMMVVMKRLGLVLMLKDLLLQQRGAGSGSS